MSHFCNWLIIVNYGRCKVYNELIIFLYLSAGVIELSQSLPWVPDVAKGGDVLELSDLPRTPTGVTGRYLLGVNKVRETGRCQRRWGWWREDEENKMRNRLIKREKKKRREYLVFSPQQEDVPHQGCRIPLQEPGVCRYLQYCILTEFAESYQAYLGYACLVQDKWATDSETVKQWNRKDRICCMW